MFNWFDHVMIHSLHFFTTLTQFQSTPIGSCLHSFCDKGAWSDPNLRPLLVHCGYKITNGHIQLYRGSNWSPKTLKKDIIGSAAMGVLGIQIVLDTKATVHDYKVVDN